MNDIAYVIAGGPSLRGFPFDALPEGRKIGANKSGWLAACDTLVTVDRNFHRHFADQITAFCGEVYVALSGAQAALPRVNYWQHRRDEGFSWVSGTLHGSNSGFAALNLAVLLGYTDIALLGFDFQWVDGQSHFHEGYPSSRPHVDRQLAGWAHAFKAGAPQLKARGVNVTNFVGPAGSRLKVFPTRPLEELI
jgi:hypothetical protein